MKKYILTCFLAASGFFGYSQQDWTLESIIGTDKFQGIPAEQIAFMEFVNLHGYYTQDQNGFKDISEFPDVLSVPSRNENFGPLTLEAIESGFPLYAYDFPLREKHYGYYRIGDTGVLFIVYPLELSRVLYERQNN